MLRARPCPDRTHGRRRTLTPCSWFGPHAAEFLKANEKVRVRIVGLDPGICNLFFAISLNGERFRYSLGEYRAHAKSEAYASRTAAWVRAAVPALPQLPAVRRPYLSIRRAYSDVVLKNLDQLLNFYGSSKFRHASLNVRNAPGRPPAAVPPWSITSHVRPWLRMHTHLHFRKRAAVVRGAKRLTGRRR